MHPPKQRLSGVTLHLIDGDGLLLNVQRQEIFVINSAAAYIWSCLEDGFEYEEMTRAYGTALDRPPADAERDVRDVLATWEAYGLLAIDPEEPAGESAQPAAKVASAQSDAATAAAIRGYRLLDSVFEVRYPTQGAVDLVDPVLRHLAVELRPGDVRVDIAEGRNGLEVYVDGVALDEDLKPEELAPQVKGALLMTAVNRHGFAAYLHSAVLRLNGALLLLPGAPGSGKTCLCLALSRRGFAYLSDEAALLSQDTLRCRAAPVSACVKEGAWSIVEPLYPQLSGLRAHHRVDGKVVKYLPPPGAPAGPARDLDWPVRWLVFPRFVPGADTTVQPLRHSEALGRLLQECNAWRLKLTAETVERLIDWITGIGCYELEFGSLDDAAEAVASICRAPD